MKRILNLILIASLILLGYEVFTKKYKPCDTPILYKVGTVDAKFGLKDAEVRSDLRESADILNKAYKKPIFSYSETGDLTINFTFDERTQLNSEINEQLGNIDEQNATIQQKIKSYEEAVRLFEKKLAVHNDTVQRYNSQGGAPPDSYKVLKEEEKTLQAEANELNKRAEELNLATRNYNLQVGEVNQDVSEFNKALSEKPEEGIFDPNTNTISVYFVNNKPELIHTIAHEFGHALGMNHVGNEKALMYEMSSKYTDLTTEDREELERVCTEIPAYQYWGETIRYKLRK